MLSFGGEDDFIQRTEGAIAKDTICIKATILNHFDADVIGVAVKMIRDREGCIIKPVLHYTIISSCKFPHNRTFFTT